MKTFDKAEGGAIAAYTLDVNDSVAMTVEFSNGALGVVHMSRFATGKRNDLELLIHGDRGALKVWSDERTSSLEVCLGRDIETQTWVAGRPAAHPAQRGALRHRAALRRERRARLPPRHPGAAPPRPRLRLRRRRPDAAGRLTAQSSAVARNGIRAPAEFGYSAADRNHTVGPSFWGT